MPFNLYSAPAPPLTYADGIANATATAADLSPGGAVVAAAKTIYPGMVQLGTILRLRARGEYTTGTTANPLALGFYWGGLAAATPIAANATGITSIASLTSVPWWMEYEGEFRAVGTSGSLKGSGFIFMPGTTPGLATAMTAYPIPITAAARTVAISTASPTVITVAGGFTAITGGSTVTCYGLSVELLG